MAVINPRYANLGEGFGQNDPLTQGPLQEQQTGAYLWRNTTPLAPAEGGAFQIPEFGAQRVPAAAGTETAIPVADTENKPIKNLINDVFYTMGTVSRAAGATEAARHPRQVAQWQSREGRYINPASPVRPDLESYLDQYPSKLESIQEGTKFNKGAISWITNTPMAIVKSQHERTGKRRDLGNWASYVSSRGLETGLGIGGGGGWGGILKSFTGGGGGGGGGVTSTLGATNAAGSSGGAGGGGGGFSIGPWGYVAGAIIGVIQGIWEWNDASKQDEEARSRARADYMQAVKLWEANQAKQRAQAYGQQLAQEKAETAGAQRQSASSAMTKKAIFMNLINQATGAAPRPYQIPGTRG